MYQDYKDLLSAFHAHGVKYPIVGGYAVMLSAQPRRTMRLPSSVHRSRASGRRSLPTAAAFFVLGATRAASIFFPMFAPTRRPSKRFPVGRARSKTDKLNMG